MLDSRTKNSVPANYNLPAPSFTERWEPPLRRGILARTVMTALGKSGVENTGHRDAACQNSAR